MIIIIMMIIILMLLLSTHSERPLQSIMLTVFSKKKALLSGSPNPTSWPRLAASCQFARGSATGLKCPRIVNYNYNYNFAISILIIIIIIIILEVGPHFSTLPFFLKMNVWQEFNRFSGLLTFGRQFRVPPIFSTLPFF